MNDWQNRLSDERNQLDERLFKLRTFLESGDADAPAPSGSIYLLREQEMHMADYLAVLNERIKRLEAVTD